MKYALTCEHCQECAELPAEGFDRDAVIDWFATAHGGHLEGSETIAVVEHVGGSLYRFAGVIGRPN